ncbi:MAG: hypothetical protein WCX64_06225 [Candidatus Micrarchaeia archaeon]
MTTRKDPKTRDEMLNEASEVLASKTRELTNILATKKAVLDDPKHEDYVCMHNRVGTLRTIIAQRLELLALGRDTGKMNRMAREQYALADEHFAKTGRPMMKCVQKHR